MIAYTVTLQPEARDDLTAIVRYYRNIAPQVEFPLEQELLALYDRLSLFPRSHALVKPSIRRVALKAMPYHVFYMVEESTVRIIALMPQKMNPDIIGTVLRSPLH